MDIKITIELAEKERDLFGAFVEAVSALALTQISLSPAKNAQEAAKASTPTENPKEVEKEEPAEAIEATEAEEPTKATPEEPEEKPAAPTGFTVEDVRKKYMDLVAKGKKEEAKAAIKKYAPNITAIKDEDIALVMLALQVLGSDV